MSVWQHVVSVCVGLFGLDKIQYSSKSYRAQVVIFLPSPVVPLFALQSHTQSDSANPAWSIWWALPTARCTTMFMEVSHLLLLFQMYAGQVIQGRPAPALKSCRSVQTLILYKSHQVLCSSDQLLAAFSSLLWFSCQTLQGHSCYPCIKDTGLFWEKKGREGKEACWQI